MSSWCDATFTTSSTLRSTWRATGRSISSASAYLHLQRELQKDQPIVFDSCISPCGLWRDAGPHPLSLSSHSSRLFSKISGCACLDHRQWRRSGTGKLHRLIVKWTLVDQKTSVYALATNLRMFCSTSNQWQASSCKLKHNFEGFCDNSLYTVILQIFGALKFRWRAITERSV